MLSLIEWSFQKVRLLSLIEGETQEDVRMAECG
jgi:hypothetical protein